MCVGMEQHSYNTRFQFFYALFFILRPIAHALNIVQWATEEGLACIAYPSYMNINFDFFGSNNCQNSRFCYV